MDFVDLVNKRKDGEPELKLEIELFAFAGDGSETGKITLVLSPCSEVPKYEGYVALDIGNTASTLVCLPTGNFAARTGFLKILDANEERTGTLKAAAEPVISHVRIDDILTVREDPAAFKWVVGRMASTGIDGLVVGTKRLAVARNYEQPRFFNTRIKVPLPRRVPAELLVCRMLQRFREAIQAQPRELALTYPTTYEPWELTRLRKVVYRGFQRAAWRKQDRATDAEAVKQKFPVMLDEASAAAYFYLYQRILETPGGLPRFRYLYPDGMNLLLYDCGGGTTDIALVNGRSEPGSNKLVISVKARSGLRSFGGDNITAAVFRILKAKIAFEVFRLEGKRTPAVQPSPTNRSAARNWMSSCEKAPGTLTSSCRPRSIATSWTTRPGSAASRSPSPCSRTAPITSWLPAPGRRRP